jgi:hypothetical protein
MNPTVVVRRSTLPWDLRADELELVSPPQADETQATKRPRLEMPFPVSADEATTKNTSRYTIAALPPPDTSADHHADSDLLTSGEASSVAEYPLRRKIFHRNSNRRQWTEMRRHKLWSSTKTTAATGQLPQYLMYPHPPHSSKCECLAACAGKL